MFVIFWDGIGIITIATIQIRPGFQCSPRFAYGYERTIIVPLRNVGL